MIDLIGKTLSNRYRIDQSLGRGGMAEVYKAWDQVRATEIALKVLRQDLARDQIFLRRFQREAETLEKLQHPNIVRFYAIEQDHLTVFILMDFIEGITLQDEIFLSHGKPLHNDFILLVMKSVCSALHYAHRQNLVHCDIKPGNIMINRHTEVLLTDFGIARMTDSATMTMVGFGTPAYMAPELIAGHEPTPQSDIYSLGIILYEMITGGERPFTGENAQITGTISEKVRWEQINLPPPSPRKHNPAISSDMESVILKCLQKKPSQRFDDALSLLSEFEKALKPKPSTDKPKESSNIETEKDLPEPQKEVVKPDKGLLSRPIMKPAFSVGLIVALFVLVGTIWGLINSNDNDERIFAVTMTMTNTDDVITVNNNQLFPSTDVMGQMVENPTATIELRFTTTSTPSVNPATRTAANLLTSTMTRTFTITSTRILSQPTLTPTTTPTNTQPLPPTNTQPPPPTNTPPPPPTNTPPPPPTNTPPPPPTNTQPPPTNTSEARPPTPTPP